ncbi:MAG TPA: hypothetical protein DEB53_05645 [Bacillus pumilus]|nr:hypothetical protein [Bacillus pumilus]
MESKLLDIFFDKQYIAPYMYLEDIKIHYEEFSDSNIYMIMLSDKYEIVEVSKIHQKLNVKYKNLSSNEEKVINFTMPFFIPSEFIEFEVCDHGTALEVSIGQQGAEFINQQKIYNVPNKIKWTIYDLVNISNYDIETIKSFEVLYIGQSITKNSGRNIYDRLSNHEKILKIYRDYNLKYRNKELMVFLLRCNSKLINKFSDHEFKNEIIMGNSRWKETDELGFKLTDYALINVTEAMLIYHFKPKYNIKFKNSVPNVELKVYSELQNAGVSEIYVGLNLFFEASRNRNQLYTDFSQVKAKLRILKCSLEKLYHKNIETDIEIEDVSDFMYEFMH